MERLPVLRCQIVAFVVGDEIYNGAFRKGRGFIQDETTFLDTRAQRAHATNVRLRAVRRKDRELRTTARLQSREA